MGATKKQPTKYLAGCFQIKNANYYSVITMLNVLTTPL